MDTDDSNENATRTSSIKTDNTREAVRGQPPPTQVTHEFYLFFYHYWAKLLCIIQNTINLHILQKKKEN